MAIWQEIILGSELVSPQFNIGMCFETSEYLIFTDFGKALHSVGWAEREVTTSNGNRPLAELNSDVAFDKLRIEASNVGLKLEDSDMGKRQAKIWADQLFDHLVQTGDYPNMPVLLYPSKKGF